MNIRDALFATLITLAVMLIPLAILYSFVHDITVLLYAWTIILVGATIVAVWYATYTVVNKSRCKHCRDDE